MIITLIIVIVSMYLKSEYHSIFIIFISLFLMPLTRFPHRLSAAMMGTLVGVYVEGVSTWGLAWIWDKNNLSNS